MVITTDAGALYAIAAAIAIAGGLIGTGMAQQGIGAAGMGIIAEKPEKFGQVLFFFVIPETLWIIGFVLGLILLLQILWGILTYGSWKNSRTHRERNRYKG